MSTRGKTTKTKTKTEANVIPPNGGGMNLVVEEDAPPPIGGTVEELVEYATGRHKLYQYLFRRTAIQFYFMGVAFAEIQRRYDIANNLKNKRHPDWLSFGDACIVAGVSETTARDAIDVAGHFESPASLENMTISRAKEIAKSAAMPDNESEAITIAAARAKTKEKKRDAAAKRLERASLRLASKPASAPSPSPAKPEDNPPDKGEPASPPAVVQTVIDEEAVRLCDDFARFAQLVTLNRRLATTTLVRLKKLEADIARVLKMASAS